MGDGGWGMRIGGCKESVADGFRQGQQMVMPLLVPTPTR